MTKRFILIISHEEISGNSNSGQVEPTVEKVKLLQVEEQTCTAQDCWFSFEELLKSELSTNIELLDGKKWGWG